LGVTLGYRPMTRRASVLLPAPEVPLIEMIIIGHSAIFRRCAVIPQN
jgi:hypothetical protein